MKLPINKTTLALTSTALIVGGVIGMADISHKVNVKNSTTQGFVGGTPTTQTGTIMPPPAETTPTDITPTSSEPTQAPTNTATTEPNSTSPSPTESTPTAAPSPPPVIRTNTAKTTRPSNSDPTINDFYCHYDYSDGTSRDVYSGSAPNDTQNGRVEYGFVCP